MIWELGYAVFLAFLIFPGLEGQMSIATDLGDDSDSALGSSVFVELSTSDQSCVILWL